MAILIQIKKISFAIQCVDVRENVFCHWLDIVD